MYFNFQSRSCLAFFFHYIVQKMLQELEAANSDLISTKTELATIRLRGAEDREKTYSEMHRIANELVDARREMKDSKEVELELRTTLQGYDEKFTTLQGSLQKTNVAYNAFSGDMQSVRLYSIFCSC
jgi:hypothetical protein